MRFLYPRVSGLVRAMRAADAELHYHNCAEAFTGIVAMWVRANGKKFVYSVASDPDVEPALPTLTRFYERWFYRAGLKRADSIIVQSTRQQRTLAAGFGRESLVLPMPCPGPDAETPMAARPSGPMRVAWIGRMDPVKRLDWLLDVLVLCGRDATVLRSRGDGRFEALPVSLGGATAQPRVAVADFDGDLRADVALLLGNTLDVRLLAGDPQAGLRLLPSPVLSKPASGQSLFLLASGDVDGDSRPDLIIGNRLTNITPQTYVLRNSSP